MTARLLRRLAWISLAGTVGASGALAAETPPAKRGEGRYFVELAEIMLSTEDFDVILGSDDPAGPRAGGPAEAVVAELPRNELGSPKVTVGLNRPSGKSAFSVSFHDFDVTTQRIPQNFDREGIVFTSDLIPPGVVYQRQAQPSDASPDADEVDDDFVPNWASEYGFRRAVSYQSADFTYERNVFENERFRLRWLGGVRYALLRETLAHAVSFTKEAGVATDGSVTTLDRQDFFFLNTNVTTRGVGPLFGLDGRWLLGRDKRWSIEGRVELAAIPESTTAKYQVSMADQSSELLYIVVMTDEFTSIIQRTVAEQPVIPGLGNSVLRAGGYISTFDTELVQRNFTDTAYLGQAQLGFRWQANDYFSVGVDLWQMRWMNVLSLTDAIRQVQETAEFDFQIGSPGASDPQLQDDEAIVRVDRFEGRQDHVFDGISLNLGFTF